MAGTTSSLSQGCRCLRWDVRDTESTGSVVGHTRQYERKPVLAKLMGH